MHHSLSVHLLTLLSLLASLSYAQQPAATPSTYIPILIPTGTSLAGSVITANPSQLVLQVQCQDPSCISDAPATASIASTSYSYAWTAANNPGNVTAYGCQVSQAKAPTDQVPCTITVGTSTVSRPYFITDLAATALPGAGQAVAITAGVNKADPTNWLCGSGTTCSTSQIPTQPAGDGPAPTSSGSASSGSAPASATGGQTAAGASTSGTGAPTEPSSKPSSGAEKVAAGLGAAMAAAVLMGAVAL